MRPFQFSTREKPAFEQRLANVSVAFLASSVLLLVAVFALAFSVASGSVWVVVAAACLLLYATQFSYLSSIGKQQPERRLRIWQLSLAGHGLVFIAVAWYTGALTLTLALLVPEVASAAIHLVGIHHARKAVRHDNPLHSDI